MEGQYPQGQGSWEKPTRNPMVGNGRAGTGPAASANEIRTRILQ
jgi:hypothetical protein